MVSDDETPATADRTVLVATTGTSTRPPDARAISGQTLSTDLLWLDGCPMLDPLRSNPRWLELRAPVLARAEKVRALLPRTNR